jgi:hypothetical protein
MVHALPDTVATRLAEDGADATEIQALLGHESLNTSQGCIDATANRIRQAARANRTYQIPARTGAPRAATLNRRRRRRGPAAATLPRLDSEKPNGVVGWSVFGNGPGVSYTLYSPSHSILMAVGVTNVPR